MGVCEDTTKGSYMRIKSYFEKKKEHSKKTIVVLLVGAADIFYDSGPEFEELYNKFISEGHILTEEITFKIDDNNNFWRNLKTLKVIKYLYFRSKQSYYKISNSLNKNDPINLSITQCLKADQFTKKKCLLSSFEQIKKDNKRPQDLLFYKKLTSVIIFNNSLTLKSREEKTVHDLLLAIETFPKMLTVPDVIYNLVSFTSLQSKYTIVDDVLPLLKKHSLSKIEMKTDPDIDHVTQSKSIIKALEKWSSDYDHARYIQKNYYEKIIDIVHQYNGEIIFLTYPLNYKTINSDIEKIAQKTNVHILDINKIFLELNSQGFTQDQLIGDWEHCTPLGYKLIAEAVAKKIRQVIQTNDNTSNDSDINSLIE